MNDDTLLSGPPIDLLDEASVFGLSHCEILELFSERRHFGYWRFDGENAYLSGHVTGLTEEKASSPRDTKDDLFHPRIEPGVRAELHEKMRCAFRERRGHSVTYPVTLGNGAVRMFTSSADFREHEDGSADLFGIFYERFIPARVIALQEAENLEE